MMTLKTILKNFLNYADTLEAQKKLGKDLYEVDFQKLKALTEQLKHDKDYTSSEGLKEVNRRKNRYKDILPYDYTRVILSEYPGVPGSDFINANYIKGASGSLAYIASQGPLPNTVVDYWRMIWECEVQVIVMACNEQESGKYKCECYWPIDDEKKQYGNINIEFVKWRQVCPDFLVRTLKACWENEERVICQFHYTTWPDHGVPNSVQPILELVRLIRDCQASEAVPVLIHCSAGCGRTGTICAIDYVWGLMRMGKLSKQFNLFNVIADMRRQRIAMVQTKEQYVLVHKAVSSLFEQQLRVIDSHTYENLDEDGEPLILKEMQEEDIYEDILEPLVSEESVSHGEKSSEWKKLPSKPFHDNVCFSTQNEQAEALSDIFSSIPVPSANHSNEFNSQGETENKSNTESVNLDQLLREADAEFETSSRNSKILLKLCREESVKRLISGWNRANEKSDDLKNESIESNETENAVENKNLSINKVPHFSHSPNEQKVFRPENLDAREKTAYCVGSCNVVNTLKSDEYSYGKDTAPTHSSPRNLLLDDGNHSGKLIGKATVIRRPSIAKLKALFEKSSQEGHDTERQRRPLFRSHSHHVSNSNRTFTVSDNVDHQSNSNCYASVSEHTVNSASSTNAQNVSSSSEQKENISSPCWNQNSSVYGQCSSQKHSRHYAEGFVPKQKYYDQSKDTCNRPVEHVEHRIHCTKHKNDPKSNDSKGDICASNAASNNFSERNENTDSKDSSLLAGDINHSYNCCSSQTTSKIKLKQSQSLGHQKKDVPPELPAKRKPAAPSIQMLKNKPESSSRNTAMKENQCDQEKNRSEQNEKSGIKRTEKLIKTFFKSSTSGNQKHSHNIVSQSWSSPLDQGIKESRRNSHEAVQTLHGTFHKHQSFSDPEQAEGRTNDLTKQKDKQKLSNDSEAVTSQTTALSNKAQNCEASSQDEGTYTNVNALAEKNIQQIENRLKSHPRGAIIDLTSRKSYIDEVSGGNSKHFVFRNTIQPVKFSPALESQDLTAYNYKNRKKAESKNKEAESGKDASVPKSNISKVERTLKDSEIDSKNLLLHSPPPKSKRSHSSKSNSKSNPPSSSSSSEILEVKSTEANQTSNGHSSSVSPSISQSTQPISNFSSSSMSSCAADRSDPRYFPVTRQTASEAKYECEKQKATSIRDVYNVPRPVSSYEPLYSTKQASYAYHKAAVNKHASETYGKKSPNLPMQSGNYSQDSTPPNSDKEPLYGLQRSASGPQILPVEQDKSQVLPQGSDGNSYHHLNEDIVKKQHMAAEPPKIPHYEQNPSFGLYGTVGTPNPYPVGPPKPPRTFHYDSKSNPSEHERNIKRDSGRYFVPVASPKHSISNAKQHAVTENQSTADYRYGERRHPEQPHDSNPTRQGYAISPQTEVPMSRSYPFTHYDSIYGHPRPYGKQFHPDAIEFRNVHVPPYPSNSIYVTAKEKPVSNQQCLYGTIKHRNAFSEYENVYNPQMSYKQAHPGLKKENQDVYQSINSHAIHGHQRSQSENNNVYSVLRPTKPPAYPPHNAVPCDFNYGMENSADSVLSPRKVYFDTLQRRHKQRVTWEQRRSHDDMDIHSAQSSRLREQIHARRSMVELDNLEISIASDEGYAEKGLSNLSPLSSQAPMAGNERSSEVSQKSRNPTYIPEFHKDSHLKKNSAHNKESGSFGETLSKAFGKLTSKFNSKEAQSSHSSSESGNSGPKTNLPVKQEKPNPNCINQSPKKSREPGPHSEQWTQV